MTYGTDFYGEAQWGVGQYQGIPGYAPGGYRWANGTLVPVPNQPGSKGLKGDKGAPGNTGLPGATDPTGVVSEQPPTPRRDIAWFNTRGFL